MVLQVLHIPDMYSGSFPPWPDLLKIKGDQHLNQLQACFLSIIYKSHGDVTPARPARQRQPRGKKDSFYLVEASSAE